MGRLLMMAAVLMAASIICVKLLNDGGDLSLGAAADNIAVARATVEKPPNNQRSNSRSVVIKSEGGHFATDAMVDGRRVDFLVDTGASLIALRESEAARLGYFPRTHDYTIKVET